MGGTLASNLFLTCCTSYLKQVKLKKKEGRGGNGAKMGRQTLGPGYEYLSAGSEMRVFDYLDIDATSRQGVNANE